MRHRFLLGLALTTSLTAPAMAEAWHEVMADDQEIAFVDADSIQRGSGGSTFTVFRGFTGETGFGGAAYSKLKLEVDCTKKQIRSLSVESWKMDRSLLPEQPNYAGWQAIEAETIGEVYRIALCDSPTIGGVAQSDPFAASDEYWDYMYYYYGS